MGASVGALVCVEGAGVDTEVGSKVDGADVGATVVGATVVGATVDSSCDQTRVRLTTRSNRIDFLLDMVLQGANYSCRNLLEN